MNVAVAADVASMGALWMGEYLAHWAELDVGVGGAAWVAHLEERRKGRYPCAVLIPIINIYYIISFFIIPHMFMCQESHLIQHSLAASLPCHSPWANLRANSPQNS